MILLYAFQQRCQIFRFCLQDRLKGPYQERGGTFSARAALPRSIEFVNTLGTGVLDSWFGRKGFLGLKSVGNALVTVRDKFRFKYLRPSICIMRFELGVERVNRRSRQGIRVQRGRRLTDPPEM